MRICIFIVQLAYIFVLFPSFAIELTLADYSSVFAMATVVDSKLRMATLIDEVLSSSALHIVQPNRTRPKTKSDVAINN